MEHSGDFAVALVGVLFLEGLKLGLLYPAHENDHVLRHLLNFTLADARVLNQGSRPNSFALRQNLNSIDTTSGHFSWALSY